MDEFDVPLDEITFSFSHSGGPGGQNVNKVETKVTLRWRPSDCVLLTEEERDRLLSKLANRINADGELVLHCSDTRSQARNRELVVERLNELVQEALRVPKKRRKTKVPRSVNEKRLQGKSHKSKKKSMRGRVEVDE